MSQHSPFQLTLLLAMGALPLMVACGPGDITAQASQDPCQNIDLDDPPQASLESESDGVAVVVTRMPIFMDCAANFDPSVEPDGDVLRIYEQWTGEEGNCCFQLSLGIKAEKPGAEIDVEWYDPSDESTPAHILTVTTP
ncbi:MAG: hypothetical protein ACI9VR_002740 [Cognaticolwellia sp.]|jgi:hypothetical protein